jgi:hypothetical protein
MGMGMGAEAMIAAVAGGICERFMYFSYEIRHTP